MKQKSKKIGKEEEYLEGWRRCQAEFENYKKRQEHSQKEFKEYAKEDVIVQILPVLDNFHSSTDHVPEEQKNNPWVQGIMHIQKQLEDILRENGVEEITAKKGDKLDPQIHEAMDGGGKKPKRNKIIKIVSRGYKLNDKVARPVKVVVE